jgi:hypothetical protein
VNWSEDTGRTRALCTGHRVRPTIAEADGRHVATAAERARQLTLDRGPNTALDVNAAIAGYEPVYRGQADGAVHDHAADAAVPPVRGTDEGLPDGVRGTSWPRIRTRRHGCTAGVDTVLAGRRITAMDVTNLRYTRRVVSGVLRLHPVLLVMRTVVKPVRLGGIPR